MDARARPRQHPARSQGAPTSVPGRPRWRGQLAVGRSEEETRRPSPRSGRVAPGCASSAEAPRRPGATTFLRWGNPTHVAEPCEPPEPPFDLQRKGSGGGGRTRGTRRARPRRAVQERRRWYRESRGTSPTLVTQEPRDGRCHRTTGAQTTEPGHHNGEFVIDVRVSLVDEGVGVVEEDELSRAARRPWTPSGSLLWSRRTTRSGRRDGQNCGHRAPRGCPADLLLGAPWVHFVSEEVYQEVSPREPGENDSARVPNFKCQEITICRKPLPPTTTPLTWYQNCGSRSRACVDL